MFSAVDILLTSYNGQTYLEDQLESILSQSFSDSHLFIRDDCSTDGTGDIIKKYGSQCPDKISIIHDNGSNLGAAQSFNKLMHHSSTYYQMLSDQDDVWLPHKVEATLNKMREMENNFGKGKPILVHTDLKVVDENLNLLSDSLWRYQLSDPQKGSSLNRLLLMNVATGCSMMINRPLINLALPIPPEAIMHDWWLALVAAAFGHIGYISEPTALYRQHGANDTGAKKWDIIDKCKSIAKLKDKQQLKVQASAFVQRYEHLLSDRQRKMMEVYLKLDTFNFFMKRYYTFKYGFFYTGLLRNIGQFLTM